MISVVLSESASDMTRGISREMRTATVANRSKWCFLSFPVPWGNGTGGARDLSCAGFAIRLSRGLGCSTTILDQVGEEKMRRCRPGISAWTENITGFITAFRGSLLSFRFFLFFFVIFFFFCLDNLFLQWILNFTMCAIVF